MTLVLDVQEFANLFKEATDSARPVFVSMQGGDANIIGLQAHEDNRINGASGVTAGGTYNNQYSFGANNADSIASLDWSIVKSAALTMALETGSRGTAWYLTVLTNDGKCTDLTASLAGLRWSSMGDITTISIDTDVVSTGYAFDGFLDTNSAYALNRAALGVPEPTTATLSLLALAGLAMRRRRK